VARGRGTGAQGGKEQRVSLRSNGVVQRSRSRIQRTFWGISSSSGGEGAVRILRTRPAVRIIAQKALWVCLGPSRLRSACSRLRTVARGLVAGGQSSEKDRNETVWRQCADLPQQHCHTLFALARRREGGRYSVQGDPPWSPASSLRPVLPLAVRIVSLGSWGSWGSWARGTIQ
jgi:hypothetical protein